MNNEQDKKAFEEWVELEDTRTHPEGRVGYFANNNNFSRDFWIAEKAWQAACEHKQKEIDELKNLDQKKNNFEFEDAKKEGIRQCINALRTLQHTANHRSQWNHSADVHFAPVELSDYLLKLLGGQQ